MNFVLSSPRFTSAYYPRANQLKLKNLDLDVLLLFLYPYVEKADEYHRHRIEVHYIQPMACH